MSAATTSIEIVRTSWVDIIQLVLIVGGWFAAFWFGIRQQRINTKEGARLKVYEEFWKQRSALQKTSNLLLAKIQMGPPFILMESSLILGNVTQNQQFIFQGQQEAINAYSRFWDDLQKTQVEFNDLFMDFGRSIEMWLHVMPDLETATRTLMSEYALVQSKISALMTYLVQLNRQQWQQWDRVIIKEKCGAVWTDIFGLMAYTEDMLRLIHNELVTPMFGYAKEARKPLDPRYKILTKDGLIAPKV